jgi:hypothetical protein
MQASAQVMQVSAGTSQGPPNSPRGGDHLAIMRKAVADKKAAARCATDPQVLEDAERQERLIADWNERQARRMPLLFSPTIGAAYRTINADLRTVDRHPDVAVTSLIQWLSCRSCQPNAPFAELVRLSRTSTADEMRMEHTRRVLGD